MQFYYLRENNMKENKNDIKSILIEEMKKFKFVYEDTVRFDEVDSIGVAHNVRYLFWLERARIEYFGNLGISINPNTFSSDLPIMVVHNEIDYFSPSHFGDKYKIFSRASFIKKSSIGFENIVTLKDDTILATAKTIYVYLDKVEKKPSRIPDDIRKLFIDFEGNNLFIKE